MKTEIIDRPAPIRASNMTRAYLCPPALWREEAMGPRPDSPEAAEGRMLHERVHYHWEHPDETAEGLTEEQSAAVLLCLNRIKEAIGEEPVLDMFWEHEYTLPFQSRPFHPDLVILHAGGDRATVIDWKFGLSKVHPSIWEDLQLAEYAVGVWHEHKVKSVRIIRFHPRVGWDLSIEMGEAALNLAWERLEQIVLRSRPEAPAVPGRVQCVGCGYRDLCPERRAWLLNDLREMRRFAAAHLETATPERVGEVLACQPLLTAAEGLLKAAKARAAVLAESGEAIPAPDGKGVFVAKPGAKKAVVTDALAAVRRISEEWSGIDLNEVQVISVSVPQASKAVAKFSGAPATRARSEVEQVLEGVLEYRQNAPSWVLRRNDGLLESEEEENHV